MEDIQTLIERIKTDVADGKSEEEIFDCLRPLLEKDRETIARLAEIMVTVPDPITGRLLRRMFELTPDKKIQKIIKRSLYRLKGKGIAVEEILSDRERGPVLRPLKAEPKEGFASGIDSIGQRLLWLILPHPGKGLTVIHGIVSDQDGIIDVSRDEMTRKNFRSFFEEIQGKNPFPFVEIEPSYVAFLFSEGYQLNLQKGSPSQDYLRAKSDIEGVKRDYARPLIYSHLQTDDISGDDRILKKGVDLLKTDAYSSWRIEEEHIRPYADEVWEAEESKIVLNQAQKEARFQAIYLKALTELFPEEKKLLYRRRLEEMAYVLLKSDKDEEAKISLSVAMELERPLNPISPNPFLFQLVIKSIFGLLSEAYEKKSKEISLIAKP